MNNTTSKPDERAIKDEQTPAIRQAPKPRTMREVKIVKDNYRSGGVKACLALLPPHRTRGGVYQWAHKLGLTAPKMVHGGWTEEELAILTAHAADRPYVISRILRKAGFNRTPNSVVAKLKRDEIEGKGREYFEASSLADMMGVSFKVVSRWIHDLGLKAEREETNRTPMQGGDYWSISRQDFRRFVIDHAPIIDLRKVSDSAWFIDLLANEAGNER